MPQENKKSGAKITAESMKQKVEMEIKKSRLKALEAGGVKTIVGEINSAQQIVDMKKEELEQLFDDHSDVLDD